MRRKALLAIGFAIGYVLGSRAGRERYDQLADAAQKLWRSPQAREARAAAAAKAEEATPFMHRRADTTDQTADFFETAGGTHR